MTIEMPPLFIPTIALTSGSLIAVVDLKENAGECKVNGILESFSVFEAAAGQGGFSRIGDGESPVSIGRAKKRKNVVELNFTVMTIDTVTFQLLRNMLARLECDDEALVTSVMISISGSQETKQLAIADEFNEPSVYPAAVQLPFSVSWEDSNYAKSRRCLISVSTHITREHIEQVTNAIAPWLDLLERGAFSMPVGHPSMMHSSRGEVAVFDESTLEIAIDRYQASECGWTVLFNILATLVERNAIHIHDVLID